MTDSECFQYWCNLASKIYLTINIATLILLFILQKYKFYEDECFLQTVYYAELEPISEIYNTSFKTDDSIQLGYLEEYSGKYIKISPKEIYKWENKYINVKRNKNAKIKTITNYILIDVKVSFQWGLDPIYTKNSVICFSKECLAKNENKRCKTHSLYSFSVDSVSEESTNDFISENSIQISSRDTPEFYDPRTMYLNYIYRDFNQQEGLMDIVNVYKRTLLSALILNPILRLIKLILLLCGGANEKNKFSLLNIIFPLIHAINAPLFLVITINYRKLPNEDSTLEEIQIALVVLEFFCLIFGAIITNYKDFSDFSFCDFHCHCYCCFCYEDTGNQTIKEKKKKRKK